MIIYKGKRAVCGLQLTIDRVWRYVLTESDTLTVRITDGDRHTIEKTYTSDDVDSIDKQIKVELTTEETASLRTGHAYITAYMNELCVVSPQKILVKEAL